MVLVCHMMSCEFMGRGPSRHFCGGDMFLVCHMILK